MRTKQIPWKIKLKKELKKHGKGEGQRDETASATQRDNTLAADIPVAWRCRHAGP